MQDSQERSVRFREVTERGAVGARGGGELPDLAQYRKTLHRSREENRRKGDCDVWILQSAYRQVVDHLTHDTSREHGGLLLGYEADVGGRPAVVIAHSLPANHTKGSPVRLEIKEDSWAEWDRISDRYTRDYGWRRIGWYHSHPGIRIFLSRWDLDVCRDWERPTHVAMVVDPVGSQGGFFVRGEEGFRSDSPQSFFEIHNVSASSLVTWSNLDSQSVPADNTAPLRSTSPIEPQGVGPKPVNVSPPTTESLPGRDRIWVYVTIMALLVLLLTANLAVLTLVNRIPQDTVNLQPLTDQIEELRAEVVRLRPTALVVTPPKPAAPVSPQAETPAASKQVSDSPSTGKLAIAKKPTILKPGEAFQFKVNGNPPPEVVWSLEGPGSIDSVYGRYRAPSQFSGEAKVKITATSQTEAQSVTFILKGTSKEEGKKTAEGGDVKQPDAKPDAQKEATDSQHPLDNAGKAQQ
jgi:proteasome lid subunit RPN8/RPN11